MLFFLSNTFISNARLALAKNQAKQHPEDEILLFENHSLSSSMLSSKIDSRYSKKCRKNQVCQWQWKQARHGHKYTQDKMCLSIVIAICIKQHLSNIWSSIHEKVNQHCGWVGKKRFL